MQRRVVRPCDFITVVVCLGFEADAASLQCGDGGGFVLKGEGEVYVELQFVGFGGGQVACE